MLKTGPFVVHSRNLTLSKLHDLLLPFTGAILKLPTNYMIADISQDEDDVSIIIPEYFTTMKCQGWCPNVSLHHYDGSECVPSQYGNGTILYKRKNKKGAVKKWLFYTLEIVHWNITECSCR